MSLQPFLSLTAQIAAATAANALPALREAVSEALAQGMSKEDIQAVVTLAQEIRRHNGGYTEHLAQQLLREPAAKAQPAHSSHCGCGCHS
ncbi:MAG: hypothetical protein LBT22_02895 [Peptococcaceae bacterium]|jgi:hypothetical protein|nr:hypothetical protein [Peptococcaceae bacterium]